MALTLLEAQKHAKTPQELAVVTELAAGQLMSVLPFRNIEGNGLFWKREESLPDVGFRNYNAALAESYAEVSQQSESLKLFGGDIKVDRAIVDLEGAEAKAYQIQSRVRSMRMAWESLFIQGDSNQSPSEFDGLAARIAAGSSQYFVNGGGALDLSKLDEVIDNVDAQGGRKYIVCSKSMRRALTKQARETVRSKSLVLSSAISRPPTWACLFLSLTVTTRTSQSWTAILLLKISTLFPSVTIT